MYLIRVRDKLYRTEALHKATMLKKKHTNTVVSLLTLWYAGRETRGRFFLMDVNGGKLHYAE